MAPVVGVRWGVGLKVDNGHADDLRMASVTIFTATELVVLTSMLVVLLRKRSAQLCPVRSER